MAAEPLEIRMARHEGAFEQINVRLGAMDQRLNALTAEIGELRRQMTGQFYWLLTLVLGSILIPILRDTIH